MWTYNQKLRWRNVIGNKMRWRKQGEGLSSMRLPRLFLEKYLLFIFLILQNFGHLLDVVGRSMIKSLWLIVNNAMPQTQIPTNQLYKQ